MTYPQLKRHLTLYQTGSASWLLLGEHHDIQCKGAVYGDLFPLLDGSHHEDELPDLLPQHTPSAIYFALMDLYERHLLVQWSATNNDDSEQERFNQAMGWRAGESVKVSPPLRLRIEALKPLATAPLNALLTEAGFSVSSAQADLVVWLVPNYDDGDLPGINRQMIVEKQSWLVVNPTGRQPMLGPLFVPEHSACWACLIHRLRFNHPSSTWLRKEKGGDSPIMRPSTKLSRQLIYHQLGLFLQAWTHGQNHLVNRLWTYDLSTHHVQKHHVVKRPQCPTCGIPNTRFDNLEAVKVTLPPSPIRVRQDGGYRDRDPRQTLRQYQKHVSPLTGIVRYLQPISGPHWAHNVDAGPNLATFDATMTQIRDRYRYLSGGKGKTASQAMASGLCEAIERVCAIYDADRPFWRRPKQDLPYKAYSPNELMLYSHAQWAAANRVDQTDPYRQLPQPYEPKRAIDWAPVWSLTHDQPRFVPLQYAYGGAPQAHERIAYASSNGNAAGNTMTEAVLQGLYELIERDAVAIWWYNRLQRPAVDLTTIADPYCQQLCTGYDQLGRDLWVLDLTHDLDIPVYAAVSAAHGDNPAILLGFGAHGDARVALERALVEMNQLLPLVAGADCQPQQKTADPAVRHWLKHATLANQPYLRAASSPARSLPSIPEPTDCKTLVADLVRQLAALDMETLVLNLTRPDIGLPVVKVMVPGLRHFWPRFAPGRLFDVPVKLGWRKQQCSEDALNSLSVFF